MNLLEKIAHSRVAQPFRKRKARRTLEKQLNAARTESAFSILDACNAQDALETPEVINILERHEFYEKAANLGYGCVQALQVSQGVQHDELAAKSDYLARLAHRYGNELRELARRTIQNYLRSARSKPNPFLQASIAAIIAEEYFGINRIVEHFEQKKDYWEAACLCEGYIAPVTARDKEAYYSPLNVEAAVRKQFAQRTIDNYLRSTPKDVKGAARIALNIFGESSALEICQKYGVDLSSAVDAKEIQMREYHRQLGILASQPFNPEALRQIITKNREILQPEIVQMILPIGNDDFSFRRNYDRIMARFRAAYP